MDTSRIIIDKATKKLFHFLYEQGDGLLICCHYENKEKAVAMLERGIKPQCIAPGRLALIEEKYINAEKEPDKGYVIIDTTKETIEVKDVVSVDIFEREEKDLKVHRVKIRKLLKYTLKFFFRKDKSLPYPLYIAGQIIKAYGIQQDKKLSNKKKTKK
jgi:hypothetical protein